MYFLFLLLFQASFLNKKLNIGGKRVNLAIWVSSQEFHILYLPRIYGHFLSLTRILKFEAI